MSPVLAGRFFTTEPPGKPQLSPAYIKCTYISLQLGKIIKHRLFHNTMLNSSCNLLKTAQKVEWGLGPEWISLVYLCGRMTN